MASALCQFVVLLTWGTACLATRPNELAAAPQTAARHPRHTLHLHLSVKELRHMFAVERHDDVPDYDLFHVRSVRKRSVAGRHRRSVHMRAFGNQIDLDLQRNDHIGDEIRLFFADARPDGIDIERVPGDTDMFVGDTYQDVDNDAALLVSHADDDTLQLSGVVADLVIAPAPRRVHGRFPAAADDQPLTERERAHLDPDVSADRHNGTAGMRVRRSTPLVTRGLHVVFRRRATDPGAADVAYIEHDDALMGHESAGDSGATGGHRQKRSTSNLYPEVLIIADYETYKTHNYDSSKLKGYMMTFMNAVDLRYRKIQSPSITIKVVGIVIGKRRDATPYLEANVVDGNALNAVRALEATGKYLFKERRLPSYDAALVVTKRDMCTRKNDWGTCNRVTAGYAYVGGGCSISKYFNKINSVALVEDSGGFSGIIVTTHELGHLMGAVHDGSPPAQYLGGPGARRCPWNDGYIMSDLRRDYKGLHWSVCSIEQFAHFATDRRSLCMRNNPRKRSGSRSSQSKLLPGKQMSIQSQCKFDRNSTPCFKDHRICTELYCFEASTGYCVSFRPAAEGSACGRGMHCIDGQCTPTAFNY